MLADTSAWARARHPAVRDAWIEAMTSERIVTCQPVMLELLYSTQDLPGFDELAAALDPLSVLPLTEAVGRAAKVAMRELAGTRPRAHRLPPVDYLVGAIAQDAGVGVLHYDEHFDRLSAVLGFESIWLAPPGSVP